MTTTLAQLLCSAAATVVVPEIVRAFDTGSRSAVKRRGVASTVRNILRCKVTNHNTKIIYIEAALSKYFGMTCVSLQDIQLHASNV